MMRKVIKFSFIFFIILIFNLLCSPLNLDEVWNYGFANNLYRGLVPYLDFNMVITPFYPFLMSLPFYIFGSSMIVFHVTNAIILTGCFVLLEKMYHDKMWIFFFFLFFPVNISAPNYSLFLLVIVVSLVYLEKNFVNAKGDVVHYFIGILLGISVLTKQTVGVFLLLPTIIFFWKDKKVLLRRILGFLLPIFVFVIYLLINKIFLAFLNLCVFGLLDFTGNQKVFNVFGILFMIMLSFTIYFIKKDKKDISNYYVLCFYSIVIPIIDLYHFFLAFFAFLLLVLSRIQKRYLCYSAFSIVSILFLGGLMANFNQFDIENYPNDLNHFEYRYIKPSSYRFTKQVLKYTSKHRNKNIMYVVPDAYYFKIIQDEDCNYFDLINQGNLGYHGSDWLLKQIKKMDNTLFIVDSSEYNSGNQIDQQALKYLLDYGVKVDSIGFYDVYVLEGE